MLLPTAWRDMTSLGSRVVARAEPRDAVLESPPSKEIPLPPQWPHTSALHLCLNIPISFHWPPENSEILCVLVMLEELKESLGTVEITQTPRYTIKKT